MRTLSQKAHAAWHVHAFATEVWWSTAPSFAHGAATQAHAGATMERCGTHAVDRAVTKVEPFGWGMNITDFDLSACAMEQMGIINIME